jgi:hypothetical protein
MGDDAGGGDTSQATGPAGARHPAGSEGPDVGDHGHDPRRPDHSAGTNTTPQPTPTPRLSSARPERYTVMLHVDAETLASSDGSTNAPSDTTSNTPSTTTPRITPVPRSHLDDGTRVSAEPRSARRRQTCRRLSCDASVVRVEALGDGRLRFLDRTGWPLPDCAPPTRLPPHPVERLIADHRRRGIDPDEDTPSARFRYAADIPWEFEARAREALDPPG